MLRNTTSDAIIVVSADPIAERAHDIFIERGGAHGSDLDDWLQAERELGTVPDAVPAKRPIVKKRAPLAAVRRRPS
jgi:Protein of unknown function (DUF2934)